MTQNGNMVPSRGSTPINRAQVVVYSTIMSSFNQFCEIRVTVTTVMTDLTHFSHMSHFYTPGKRRGISTFSGGTEMWHWTKIG